MIVDETGSGTNRLLRGEHSRVALASYFSAVSGVGEVGRRLASGLSQAGLEVARLSLVGDRLRAGGVSSGPAGLAAPQAVITCVNFPDLAGLRADAGTEWLAGAAVAGMAFWEAGSPPRRWTRHAELFDEIWVPNQHVANQLASLGPPVRVVDVPLSTAPVPAPARNRFGLPPGLVFLVVFDYNSGLPRKNPLAAIEAYRRAFAPEDGVTLVVKSINHDRHRRSRALVHSAVADRPDIRLIERQLPDAEMGSLLASSDCLITLHRAEGLCIPALDAMALGKPVIATGWSGNMGYMHPGNAMLVDYDLVAVDAAAYDSRANWAEPSLDHAAAHMRRILERPADAAALGHRAGREVQARFAAGVAGRQLRQQVEDLRRRPGRSTPVSATSVVKNMRRGIAAVSPHAIRIAPRLAAAFARRAPVYLRPSLLESSADDTEHT